MVPEKKKRIFYLPLPVSLSLFLFLFFSPQFKKKNNRKSQKESAHLKMGGQGTLFSERVDSFAPRWNSAHARPTNTTNPLQRFSSGTRQGHALTPTHPSATLHSLPAEIEANREPFLTVSGVLPSGDWGCVSEVFRGCGDLVFEQKFEGRLWLKYSESRATSMALSKHNGAIQGGVYVSVGVAERPPQALIAVVNRAAAAAASESVARFQHNDIQERPSFLSTAVSKTVTPTSQRAGQQPGARGAALVPIPSSSLSSVTVRAPEQEHICHKPMKRPHYALRLFLLQKEPKEAKCLPNMEPVPEVCLWGSMSFGGVCVVVTRREKYGGRNSPW